jgi:hypothetical protein
MNISWHLAAKAGGSAQAVILKRWSSSERMHATISSIRYRTEQFVFSIPVLLRVYFKYDRELLTEFCHCTREGLEIFFRTVLGFPDGIPGLVMVIHTFRDYARFHPHLHAIVADGLFRKNGTFYPYNVT